MRYELEVITDIVSTNTKTPKIIKKDVKIKKIFDLDLLEVEQYIDGKTGKVLSNYCSIFKEENYYKINKPYEELKSLVLNRTSPILGYIGHSKHFKKYK